MKRIELPWSYIVGLWLYIYWAMGDPHLTIWHWILPIVFHTLSRLVYGYGLKKSGEE